MSAAQNISRIDLSNILKRNSIGSNAYFSDPDRCIEGLLDRVTDLIENDEYLQAEVEVGDAISLSVFSKRPELEARSKNILSYIMDLQGDYKSALSLLEDSLGIFTRLGDLRGRAVCLGNIGGIRAGMNQFDAAMEYLRQALSASETLGDERLSAGILLNIGRNYSESGFEESGLTYFQEARSRAETIDNADMVLACLVNESDALINLGRREESLGILEYSRDFSVLHNNAHTHIVTVINLGRYSEKFGSTTDAVRYFTQARDLARSLEYAEGELNAALNLGRVNVDGGDAPAAAEQLLEALRLAVQLDRPNSRRDAHLHLSRLYKREGELALALEHFEAYHAEERALFSAERDKTTRTLMMQFDVERAQTQARAERESREHAERLQAEAEAQVRERTAELEQAQMEVVGRLAMAAEFRDDATGEHTRRVGVGSALIAETLGLSRGFVETLQVAARLHDVGKLGIPDAVLLKAGKLTVAEFEDMKRHTTIGARLLSGGRSEVLDMARQIALTHHERWDGNGYPHGLTGTEIPLVGRIVALADVFDALVHRRPYKAAWAKSEALAELARQRGRHFDPELTDAALKVFGSGRYEAALLAEDRPVLPVPGTGADAVGWEVEALRVQYEALLAARTAELEAARALAEGQVAALRVAAFTDALTGLHNRRAFEADVQTFAEEAQESGRTLGVISLDLDDLKRVNDSGGHASGDALIMAVAGLLRAQFEPVGRVYRMGGDEFAVLLWSDAQLDGTALAGDVARLEEDLGALGFASSLSAGVACWPQDADDAGSLLRLSDERMYAQKRARKGQEGTGPA